MPYEPYLLLPLRRRDGTLVAHAIIGPADSHLAHHRWYRRPNGYVARRISAREAALAGSARRLVFLHRVVLGLAPDDPLRGDHIDGNRLDCRRSNLRPATRVQNAQNVPARGGTSPYRGVSWHKTAGKWRATVAIRGRQINLGRFVDELEAARVVREYRLAHLPFTNEERSVWGAEQRENDRRHLEAARRPDEDHGDPT